MADLDLGINLYEFNKEGMKTLRPLTKEEYGSALDKIGNKMSGSKVKHYMLLCHEKRDYSLFRLESKKKEYILNYLSPTLKNRGVVVAVDTASADPDNSFEIWIRNIMTGEDSLYYLFPYDEGLIIVEGPNGNRK